MRLLLAGTSCIDPPDPHSKFKLHPVWTQDDGPVSFGSTVTYACEIGLIPGASDNFGDPVYGPFVFQNDPDKSSMEVECLDSGYFDLPGDWPSCVDSKR